MTQSQISFESKQLIKLQLFYDILQLCLHNWYRLVSTRVRNYDEKCKIQQGKVLRKDTVICVPVFEMRENNEHVAQ